MAELLLDTDVLVDHLRGTRRIESEGEALAYSVITRAELFAGPQDQERVVTRLLAGLREIGLDGAVAEAGGRIRRETGVKLPDALIAASAIVHGLVLVSGNRRDYERVPGLELRPP